jgi:Ribonuclease G/E
MLEPQSVAKSSLTLAFEALRKLQREARARPAANWRLIVGRSVEAALRGPAAAAVAALETRLGRKIVIEAELNRDRAAFDIVPR